MWTLFDTTAIVLTLVATALHEKSPNEYLNGLNALVVGLLWIKVLGFLKLVNRQMSTFILALSQILYAIRLFMVVLLVCISMFGDMFHIAVSTKDDGEFCGNEEQESGTLQDFCKSSSGKLLCVPICESFNNVNLGLDEICKKQLQRHTSTLVRPFSWAILNSMI
jgi:hypothetical protein